MSDNNSNNWKEREIGGLWKRKSKSGNTYLFLRFEVGGVKYEATAMSNRLKEPGDKTPDYRIYKADPQGQQAAPAAQPPVRRFAKSAASAPARKVPVQVDEVEADPLDD